MRKFFAQTIFLFSFSLIFSHSHSLNLIKDSGENLTERISTPPEFVRVEAEEGSFAEYLRNYPLKEAGSPVLLFDGRKKQNQASHAAVFAFPIEERDLQKSSDTILQFYAEYLYKRRAEEKIEFHGRNGTVSKWSEYKKKFRIDVSGNLKKWTKFEKPANKNRAFASYLRDLCAYTDEISLMIYDSEPTTFEELKIGDILMDIGKPSFVCLVVDICKNPKTGEKAVLLAEGGQTAQDFHVIRNPKRETDPWYHEEDFFVPAVTPEHTYPKESWRKLKF